MISVLRFRIPSLIPEFQSFSLAHGPWSATLGVEELQKELKRLREELQEASEEMETSQSREANARYVPVSSDTAQNAANHSLSNLEVRG